MSEPHQRPAPPTDSPERRTRRAWAIFATAFAVLGLLLAVRLLAAPAGPIDAAVVGLVIVVGLAAVRHRRAVTRLEAGRRSEAESFARILSSLSRSVSPDAIVDAIVTELAAATGADHIVVARRRSDARVLEATLVSARPGVPNATTLLPIGDLEDHRADGAGPGGPVRRAPVAVPIVAADPIPVAVGPVAGRTIVQAAAGSRVVAAVAGPGAAPAGTGGRAGQDTQAVAERIAARARTAYGLTHTLTAPLTADGAVIGAIVLSHRTAGAWSETTRRLLGGAASEASAALARADSQRAVEAQASTDALTGLPNRRYFDEFCGLLSRRRRAGDAVGVLMIDVDRFKALNDAHGHAAGDEVLRAVGGAILAAVREDDVPARYGGEEFVVLLRNPTGAMALDIGERVRSAVAGLDLARLGVRRVTVSVGVAVASRADQPVDDLVREADRALFRAKRAGRDRVVAA